MSSIGGESVAGIEDFAIDFVVSVGEDQFGVVEGCLLQTDSGIGEVFEELNDLCDFGGVALEIRDTADVGVEAMERVVSGLHFVVGATEVAEG